MTFPSHIASSASSRALRNTLLAAALVGGGAQAIAQPHVVVERSRISPAQAEAIRGTYALSDGRDLVIGGSARRPTMQLGMEPSVALVKTGENQFESADGQVRIELQAQANGQVNALTLRTAQTQAVAMR
jgi:hypothetical protein